MPIDCVKASGTDVDDVIQPWVFLIIVLKLDLV